jgi:hypothetical protein
VIVLEVLGTPASDLPSTDAEVDASARDYYASAADVVMAPKKKRAKSTSPTQRTLAECRKRGWTAGVVEQFVRFPAPGHRRDLFGVIDLVAIVSGDEHPYDQRGILAIQACAGPSHADRRDKILAEPRARQWIEAGGRLELWSWAKRGDRGKRKLWTLRVEVFTTESWRAA